MSNMMSNTNTFVPLEGQWVGQAGRCTLQLPVGSDGTPIVGAVGLYWDAFGSGKATVTKIDSATGTVYFDMHNDNSDHALEEDEDGVVHPWELVLSRQATAGAFTLACTNQDGLDDCDKNGPATMRITGSVPAGKPKPVKAKAGQRAGKFKAAKATTVSGGNAFVRAVDPSSGEIIMVSRSAAVAGDDVVNSGSDTDGSDAGGAKTLTAAQQNIANMGKGASAAWKLVSASQKELYKQQVAIFKAAEEQQGRTCRMNPYAWWMKHVYAPAHKAATSPPAAAAVSPPLPAPVSPGVATAAAPPQPAAASLMGAVAGFFTPQNQMIRPRDGPPPPPFKAPLANMFAAIN